jgi:hypothetical protein
MSFFICSQRYGWQEGKGRQIVTFVERMMVDGSDVVGRDLSRPSGAQATQISINQAVDSGGRNEFRPYKHSACL